MNWENEGYLLSKIKFRENASIVNVFTKNYGKVSGIVYGGNSRKVRNYLQIGNKIFVILSLHMLKQLIYLLLSDCKVVWRHKHLNQQF